MSRTKARTNLKIFRVSLKLTQEEIAKKIGCNRGTYAAIENGSRNGRADFWLSLQKAFPTANIGELMKVDED